MKLFRSSQSKYSLALIAFLLPILPACGPRYKAKELNRVNTFNAEYQAKNSDVALSVHMLDKDEANEIFDGRGAVLFDKKNPICPLHCTVTNTGYEKVTLDKKDIELSLMDNNFVVERMKSSALKTGFMAYVYGSLLTVGVVVASAVVGVSLFDRNGAANLVGVTSLVAPAACQVGSFWYADSKLKEANESVYLDVYDKNVPDRICIHPNQTVSFILFADGRKSNPQFDMNFMGAYQHQITFHVDVRPESARAFDSAAQLSLQYTPEVA